MKRLLRRFLGLGNGSRLNCLTAYAFTLSSFNLPVANWSKLALRLHGVGEGEGGSASSQEQLGFSTTTPWIYFTDPEKRVEVSVYRSGWTFVQGKKKTKLDVSSSKIYV
jgi:hypothetical protein